MKSLTMLLSLLLAVAAPAQTKTVAVFFQPARNVPMLAGLGVNTFCGPEVENSRALSADALAQAQSVWINAVATAGAKCLLKNPPAVLPTHCVGVMFQADEPNGKGTLAAAMKAESDALAAKYPGIPRWLSLAGDKILSANFDKPAEAQAYKDYGSLADVLTINFYARNRNADRYPDTHPGDCAAKLAKLTGKPVLVWLECNDQQLAPPPVGQGTNRSPTPAEMSAQAKYAITQGAWGIGWFATCDSGKFSWPASYWPLVDRAGASMAPQYAMVQSIDQLLNPPTTQPATLPTTQPSLEDRIKALEAWRQTMGQISTTGK